MSGGRTALASVLALLGGAALWTGVAVLGGRLEPWDAPLFWRAAYPAAIGLCALLGLIFPDRAWRWAVYVFAAQVLVMVALGADFSLLPLGLVLLAVLALPGVWAALVAARLRRRSA